MALRVDGPLGSWVGVWRPAQRQLHHLPAPEGWLAGTGLWTAEGVLRLPCATPAMPCGVAVLNPPGPERRSERDLREDRKENRKGSSARPERPSPEGESTTPAEPAAPRPVPLQQAPLGRLATK